MESALLVGIVLLLLWFGTNLSRHLAQLSRQIQSLQDELSRLRATSSKTSEAETNPLIQRPASTIVAKPAPAPEIYPEEKAPIPQPVSEPAPFPISADVPPREPRPLLKPSAPPQRVAAFAPPAPAEKIDRPAKDWEKFIGENLINKLGIVILVLGIGFFVKFAIDKDWINEVGRVAIGHWLAGGRRVAGRGAPVAEAVRRVQFGAGGWRHGGAVLHHRHCVS